MWALYGTHSVWPLYGMLVVPAAPTLVVSSWRCTLHTASNVCARCGSHPVGVTHALANAQALHGIMEALY